MKLHFMSDTGVPPTLQRLTRRTTPAFAIGGLTSAQERNIAEHDELYGATPGCDGRVKSNFYQGGGVKCGKCRGWFCY